MMITKQQEKAALARARRIVAIRKGLSLRAMSDAVWNVTMNGDKVTIGNLAHPYLNILALQSSSAVSVKNRRRDLTDAQVDAFAAKATRHARALGLSGRDLTREVDYAVGTFADSYESE